MIIAAPFSGIIIHVKIIFHGVFVCAFCFIFSLSYCFMAVFIEGIVIVMQFELGFLLS